MKKIIFLGVLGLFLLGSCNSKSGSANSSEGHANCTGTHDHEGDNHEGHDHGSEGHDHEGHDHGAEGHEGHDHGNEAAANSHSDEIIFPKEKADAAGIKVSEIKPGSFQQVIKTSGKVLAAQGDESVAVATVAGVVKFRGKVTEGMNVAKEARWLASLRATLPKETRCNVPELPTTFRRKNTNV
ncbi:cation efflux system protein [Bacteroides reticulotermitis JCM 10512]|uniref:Cation efflux system protein n=1 Tax=Bacteroides reticulotermitis JCM 10512 TaxID=1445607 RepID=W4UUU4_9BACE|nr:cation efflux system protein [Bacteroides reticulotermitis JCM 10512]